MKHKLAILLALPLLMMPALASCGYSLASDGSEPKAAIIDQLSTYYPNQSFINKTTEILEAHGFTVDVWPGEETTASFYRELPQYGYKLILFRAHLGIAHLVGGSKIVPLQITSLFTGETYTTTKYVAGQLSGSIFEARMTEDHPTVFAVSPKFITNNMRGKFDDTAILMMGCTSYYLDDLAIAFVQKGASVYVGWSATVTLDYLDRAAVDLIENLSAQQLSIEEATAQTMAEVGRDPYYGARLKYYPAESGHQTITELIK